MGHFANLKNLFRPINTFAQIHDVNKRSSMFCLDDIGTVVLEKKCGSSKVKRREDGRRDGWIVHIINLLIKSIYI